MSIFITLLLKIIPLYFIILLGFIAGRGLGVRGENISKLLIYIITPFVILNGVLKAGVSIENIMMPVTMLALSFGICALSFLFAKRTWNDSRANIFAFSSGTANTGYFGIPVVAAILGQDAIGILLYFTLGLVVFENTLGFYITARGNFTASQSLRKVYTLPTLYAFVIAITLNAFGYKPDTWLLELYEKFLGTYSVLGMMLIGIAIGNAKCFSWDGKFVSSLFIVKFLVWPTLTLGIIWLDKNHIHLFSEQAHKVLFILSTVPLAANTVAYAAELGVQTEKVALTVLLSTVFALFFIPLAMVWLAPL